MENEKLYKKIAKAIEAAISAGQYSPGERLPPERELVEKFSVSRPTIREAMLVLEVRGLVEPRHGSGVYVVEKPESMGSLDIDLDIGAIDLTEARALIEGEVAALAAAEIKDEELVELENILQRMIQENRAVRLDAENADRDFHIAISKATHNTALVSVVEELWSMRDRARLAYAMLNRARRHGMKPAIEEHRAILLALKARDSSAARKAMQRHLHRVVDGLLEATEVEEMERTRKEIQQRNALFKRRRKNLML